MKKGGIAYSAGDKKIEGPNGLEKMLE